MNFDKSMGVLTLVLGAALTIVLVLLALARRQKKAPSAWVLSAAAALIPVEFLAAGLMLSRSPDDLGPAGTISIAVGPTEVGCVTNVSGTADVPPGKDAWLFLNNEKDEFYAQGSKPIMEGKRSDSWSLPETRIADKFFENARYSWVAIIVTKSESDRLKSKMKGSSLLIKRSDFPGSDRISASDTMDFQLTKDEQCTGSLPTVGP